MTLSGIDVSSNNGLIDWEAVAASGIQFAVIKATEGTRYVNPQLAADLAAARAAGLLIAVYHYALPAWNAPADEAAHFVQVYQPLAQAFDVLALDLEEYQYGRALPSDCGPWALAWLSAVEAEFDCKPLLYTNANVLGNNGAAVVGEHDYGLWLAAWASVEPPTPAPWSFTAIWQHSASGRVPGILGDVDLDQFNGDEAAWRRYGIPADVPKPAQPSNDDLVQVFRLVLGADYAGARSYLGRFTR